MEIIQVLIVLFALFVLSRVFLRAVNKEIKSSEFLFWSILWLAIIIVALLPSVTSFFSNIFGIGRGIDFFVYSSIIILFYLLFRIYVKIDKIEHDISKIVREIALRKK